MVTNWMKTTADIGTNCVLDNSGGRSTLCKYDELKLGVLRANTPVRVGMNAMKLVISLHSLYWSIHTKDESKRGTAFAFIFGVN